MLFSYIFIYFHGFSGAFSTSQELSAADFPCRTGDFRALALEDARVVGAQLLGDLGPEPGQRLKLEKQ